MLTIPKPTALNGETLLSELRIAGVSVPDVGLIVDGDDLMVDADETDRSTIETVVASHTGEPSPRVVHGPAIRQAALDHLTTLRTIKNSSGTLTGAQLSNAVRAIATGQIHLIRLALSELDDIG